MLRQFIFFVFIFICIPGICQEKLKSKKVDCPVPLHRAEYYSATIFFHDGSNVRSATQLQAKTKEDIFDFIEREKKDFTGEIMVSINEMTYTSSDGKTMKIDVTEYNKKWMTEVMRTKNKALQLVDSLRKLNLTSGIVYFSGPHFETIATVKATDKLSLNKNYNLSIKGTLITFQNCIYKNQNNSLEMINKSVRIE